MALDTSTLLTPAFADATTTTTVGTPPDQVVYPCSGPNVALPVQARHVADLLSAGWQLPPGQEPPAAPEPSAAGGVVPDPDAPPPTNPALEVPEAGDVP